MGRKAAEPAVKRALVYQRRYQKRDAKTRAAITAEFQKHYPADPTVPPDRRCVFTTRYCRRARLCMYSIEEARKVGGIYAWRHWDVCARALGARGDANRACFHCAERKAEGCGKAWRCVFLAMAGEGEGR